MNIFAISNQKGGVGKSTTACALGAGFARKGYRVLFVDLDPQGNLSYLLGVPQVSISTLELLCGTHTAAEAVVATPCGDLLPATPSLSSIHTMDLGAGKEFRLRDTLKPLGKRYDVAVVDTPPALSLLTINALTACQSVIVPTQADVCSLQGIGQLYQTLQAVRTNCNPALSLLGILVVRYAVRSILARDMLALLQETAQSLHTRVFRTAIRECVAIKEAQAKNQDVFTYHPQSNAAKDYGAFVREVMACLKITSPAKTSKK